MASQVILDQGRSLRDSMGKKCQKRYKGALISCHLILTSCLSALGPALQGSRFLPSNFFVFPFVSPYTPG
jgi:hypothetical protein